jgi:NADH dehydrogenase (ubiquinone) 1 alpha subcomplex subunit 10
MMLYLFNGAPSKKTTVVYVEGNVGAGKSESMAAMKDYLKKKGYSVMLFVEETETWEHEHLLQDLYAQPHSKVAKRAFEALGPLRQYIERAHFIDKCGSEYDFVIMERHPTTTLEVFGADNAVRALFKTVHASSPFMAPPQTTIYVKASPSNCLERIIKRGRECERSIDLAFIKSLDTKHGIMMLDRRNEGSVVIAVDSNNMTATAVAEKACAELLVSP